MKRIIALFSFLVLLLMTVLPANVSHAAAANEDAVTGITFFMENGTKINAVKNGSNFTLDLVGDVDFGDQLVTKAEIYSNTAATLSVVPSDFDYSTVAPYTKDEFDIQFVNGVAVLDVEKVMNWSKRIGGENPGLEVPPNGVFTLSEFKSIAFAASLTMGYGDESPYVLPGYVTDKDGNESAITLTVITDGWKYVGGWKYFGIDGEYLTGWFQDGDNWYYLNDNGVMKTGWLHDTNGKWYYLNGNGTMATGWAKVGTKWYYFDSVNGDMKTGWFQDANKTWYYLDAVNGDMKTGWAKVSNKWYYFNASGVMATGWANVSNKWYYLNASGAMATGWVKVSNKWYYLYTDGHMAASTKIGSYRIGKDGAWIQ